jgi:hypothetical protein
VASNLGRRLDKLEKGIQQFLEAQNPTGPIYLAEGESAPEGREAIHIVMQWVEAEHQEEDSQSSQVATLEALNSAPNKTILTLPPSESPAERDRRWKKHVQALELRGERWDGDEDPIDPRRADWKRGIV